MDPKEREELCNTGPEEETVARRKNRSRRVSFAAEITSVHFFDRDEEYETPPDSKPNSENSETREANEDLGFQNDVGGSDDSKELTQNGEDDEDDEDDEVKAFVRDMVLSSPGSAIGSATSNDEENFFGPVSASFIRSGQPSDSAASDDNHDITLDSTAFSMHFRSLVHSSSGGDFKTPSRHHLPFEERTPSETSMPTNQSSFMALTGIKKPLPHCSVSDGKSSGVCESNDMSLVVENPHRYDYGRLSPTLGALLAEGGKDLHGISVSNDNEISNSSNCLSRDSRFPTFDRLKSNSKDLKDSGSEELHNIVTNDMPVEVISGSSSKSHEGSVGSTTPRIDQISHDCSSSTKQSQPTDASIGDHSQILCESVKEMPLYMNKGPGRDALEARGLISEVGACNSATSKSPSKTLDVNLIADRDCGFLDGLRALRMEGPTDYGSLTPTTLQISDRQCESPLAGSVSLLCAKRRQLFCNGTVSPGSKQSSIPFDQKHHSSSLENDRRGLGKIGTSIEKSISKLKFLDTSVTVEDGFDTLKPKFFDNNCKLAAKATGLGENSENLKLKKLEISATALEGHLLYSAQKNSAQRDTVNTNAHGSEASKNVSMMPRQAEKDVHVVHDGEFEEQISNNVLCSDQPSKVMTVAVSPFQFSRSGKQMQEHPLASHDSVERTFITSRPGSLLVDITEDANAKKQLTVTSDKFSASPFQFSSSGKQMQEHPLASHDSVEGTFITSRPGSLLVDITEDANAKKQLTVTSDKFSASPEHAGILSRALKQQDQGNMLLGRSSGQDVVDSGLIAANVSHLTPETKKDVSYLTPVLGGFGSLLKQKRSQSASPIIGNNSRSSVNVAKLKRMGDNQLFHDLQNESGNITALQLNAALNSQSRNLVRNHRTGTDLSMFRDKLSEEELKESLYESTSPYVLEKATTTPFPKVLVDQMAQTPSLKEASNFPYTNRMQYCVGKDTLSPKLVNYSNQKCHSSSRQDLHILQQLLPTCVENSGRKRKSEDVILMENIQVEETGRTQKSPKVLEMDGSVPEFSSEHLIVIENEVDRNQVDRVPKLSSEVFSKLYGAMKQLLSESRHELNLLQLHILEDILDQLQKAKKYEKLCAVIQFQKRVAEARCLQQMLVYEQAKLQLMRVKHEITQKRLRLLQSGIQEFQNWKLCSLHYLFMPGVRGAEPEGTHLTSLSVNGKNEEARDKVITMKKELGDLDEKIKSIIKCFHDSCHIKGELSYDESVAIVNDYLKKRKCCSFIRQDMQPWSVDDQWNESGHHNIALNYHNFLFQSLTIIVHPISSIVAVSKLNDTNIIKAFPSINACTAFAFVFNAEATDKRSGSKCLAEETQITSSLLGNLLDVIEEVQAARIKLPDLVETSFYSPCAKQLNLRLCFIHFKTGMKVILILDMTYLNCGVYPSDVVPSHVSTNIHGVETPVSSSFSLSPEIIVAVDRLKAGRARIIRLCRCVSQVVQAWNR
ncbi:uncharacterized protein LOC122094027 isoform X2 [Macadamia integrifolia]|uniref:uncharacterized protein LOC122094027 isoform X2 n=1 Tax=Macadamia integrifolia TaxID=60698 RepID=UPI001C52842D|nr:uncharacterized protein LOC122094027 isoform X2 [Macadamia integrifolia]